MAKIQKRNADFVGPLEGLDRTNKVIPAKKTIRHPGLFNQKKPKQPSIKVTAATGVVTELPLPLNDTPVEARQQQLHSDRVTREQAHVKPFSETELAFVKDVENTLKQAGIVYRQGSTSAAQVADSRDRSGLTNHSKEPRSGATKRSAAARHLDTRATHKRPTLR